MAVRLAIRSIATILLSLAAWLVANGTHAQGILADSDPAIAERLERLKQRTEPELRKYEDGRKRQLYPFVVFIPGILGSKIEECDRRDGLIVNCANVWGRKIWSDGLRNADLSIKTGKHYQTSVLDNFHALGTEVQFYGEGLSFIYQQLVSDEGSLVAYSYDWRQDNRISALKLHDFLCDLPLHQNNRPIVFIAHSMGGLVLKFWLAKIYETELCPDRSPLKLNIQEAIFVGTPHYGAPEAIKAFASGFSVGGDNSGVFGMLKALYSRHTIEQELNKYGTMFPSAYQLLPIYGDSCVAQQSATLQLTKPIVTAQDGIFDIFSANAWRDAGWPKHLQAGISRAQYYQTHLPSFLRDARDYLCVVANATIPATIEVTYFMSSKHKTLVGLKLKNIPFGNATAPSPKTIDFDKVEADGDGTVPFQIAAASMDTRNKPRTYTDEKHEHLLNSTYFKNHIQRLYTLADYAVKEALFSEPRYRDAMRQVYLEAGRYVFAGLPGDADYSTDKTASGTQEMFKNTVAFNRSLMAARGLTIAELQHLESSSATGSTRETRSILLALQDPGTTRIVDNDPSHSRPPLRLVAAFPPGGSYDLTARVLGERLTRDLGRPVVVENVAGGAGLVAMQRVAAAVPDGNTVILATSSAITLQPLLVGAARIDPLRDLIPIAKIASTADILAVNTSLPVGSVRDLVALAKAKPGTLTYATAGNGTQQHLAGELLRATSGINIQHIPYRGGGTALNALTSREVSMVFGSLHTVLPLARQGKLRPLAITSAMRSPLAPDLPTMVEAGVPRFESTSWIGLFAPANTPREVVSTIHNSVAKALDQPEVQSAFQNLGLQVSAESPERFLVSIRADRDKWASVARAANIRN